MPIRKTYEARLSGTALELIRLFNDLPSGEEQSQVVDILYDAMYGRNIRDVLSERVISEKDKDIAALREEVAAQKKTITALQQTRILRIDTAIPKDERQRLQKELVKEKFEITLQQAVDDLKRENNSLRGKLRNADYLLSQAGIDKPWLKGY